VVAIDGIGQCELLNVNLLLPVFSFFFFSLVRKSSPLQQRMSEANALKLKGNKYFSEGEVQAAQCFYEQGP
tara:strand:- start:302 stop:514 length:213 start_codon:yes stop_codon:yes gene_type:complete